MSKVIELNAVSETRLQAPVDEGRGGDAGLCPMEGSRD